MNKVTNLEVEQFLSNFKKTSEVEFLEIGKEKNDLIESAKKRGILIEGSRDLGILKTVYCFTDKANANGAILPSKEFQRKLPQIVGKPMNVNHIRDLIVGFYIDYKYIYKENKAITYAVFFKSIYPDLWKKAKLFKGRGKLSSSFEIWNPKSKRKYHNDGTYEIYQMELAGGALVFEEHGNEPAFKDAKVLDIAKKVNISECVGEECLVCASKYKEEEIIVANTSYFRKSVEENFRKLQEEKKTKAQPQKVEPKIVDKKPEVKVEVKPEEKKEEPQINKLKCSNCGEEMDYNGMDVRIKCSKCFAILNKEGIMQYPPQIKDFQVLCPSCKVGNWLILSKSDIDAKVRCETCAKQYKIDFQQSNVDVKKLLDKINFVYIGKVTCPQCKNFLKISGASTLKNRNITCPKCKMEFAFDITHEQYKKISKIEEIKIDKIEKSTKTEKGGKEMDYKIELSKYHRYVDAKDFDKILDEGYNESMEKAARLTTEQRNALPDSDFAVVVRVKDKRTGRIRKIRMYPIHDKAHVRNALARLGQDAPKATLKRLGVSIENVKKKIMRRASQLKMKLAESKKVESKKKTKIAKATDTISDALKKDLELYEKEDKEAAITQERKRLTDGIRKITKQLIEAKKEVKMYKENAVKVYERRQELGDFAKDLSDNDIIDNDKFEKAQLKKQVASTEHIETASEQVGEKKRTSDIYSQYRTKIDDKAFGDVNKRINN